MSAPPVIEARGLRKRYGDFTAVDGIDFTVARGECFGFLGPNGAGKSSTMRTIYRASPASGGTLRILGHEVGDTRGDRDVKRALGVVPQEDSLDQELTVRENLDVFRRFYGIPRAEAASRIEELLRFFDLVEKADARVERLSGGMKRRALIARALIHDPAILILDEPTTGLDPQARHHLWDRLRALRRRGATLLLTTHYMDEAEQLCDRLVIMDRGKIVAEGPPRRLIEEHVPPHVVELGCPDGVPTGVKALESAAEHVERLSERVLLYTRDPEALIGRAAHEAPRCTAMLRRATLEDVFLKITGRGLGE